MCDKDLYTKTKMQPTGFAYYRKIIASFIACKTNIKFSKTKHNPLQQFDRKQSILRLEKEIKILV